jgi:hypothetical protein
MTPSSSMTMVAALALAGFSLPAQAAGGGAFRAPMSVPRLAAPHMPRALPVPHHVIVNSHPGQNRMAGAHGLPPLPREHVGFGRRRPDFGHGHRRWASFGGPVIVDVGGAGIPYAPPALPVADESVPPLVIAAPNYVACTGPRVLELAPVRHARRLPKVIYGSPPPCGVTHVAAGAAVIRVAD